jgi:hypothetical protein
MFLCDDAKFGVEGLKELMSVPAGADRRVKMRTLAGADKNIFKVRMKPQQTPLLV